VARDSSDGTFHPFMNGIIYRKTGSYLLIAMNDGSLIINEVFNQDGENIINQIKIGNRFYTPSKYLDDAMSFRAVYDSKGLK
jgi:hypothetical protein